MKPNSTHLEEAVHWLESFAFIGVVFPITQKNYNPIFSDTEYVVMCNTQNLSKPIEKVLYKEFVAYKEPMYIIQMGDDAHKIISKKGSSTISARVLIELAFETPLDNTTFKWVMNKFLGINYDEVFNKSRLNDFNKLITQQEILYQCLRFVEEALAMIFEQGLTYDLMLQTKIFPIYEEIFRNGFLMDIKGMQNEYMMIENENRVMIQYFNDQYSTTPDDSSLYERLDADGIQILHRYQKNQLMLSKYPLNKLIRTRNGKKYPYLTCLYKQIGTRTLRLSTSQINIYGLPKRVFQHLIPNDGNVFVEADFHASELLIIANLACEEWLIQAYQQGNDIYNMFATSFFCKSEIDIQPKERKAIKKLFFAYINGARMTTLYDILKSLDIQISYDRMSLGLQHLKESIPKVITYLKSLRYKINVRTPSGRWWSEDDLPELKKRAAYIIQIVESEILFNAVLMVHEEVSQYEGMRIYLTKHDSITIEAPFKYVDEAKTILYNNMTKAVQVFFDMTYVQININVTPYIEEKENTIMNANTNKETMKNKMMSNLNLSTLSNIKQQLKAQKKKTIITTVSPVPEEEYLAIIKDVIFDKENNIVKVIFIVFIGDKTFTYQAKFNLSTNAVFYYESIVQLLGDEDGYIVGALCFVVFHKNQQYLNIEVIDAANEEELAVLQDSVEETRINNSNSSNETNRGKNLKDLTEDDDDDYEDDELQEEFDDEEVDE